MTNYKKDFPLLENLDIAYLDNAATTQKPKKVLDAERKFYETSNANPLRGLYELGIRATECYEEARETVRELLNAKTNQEIIFTRNSTESINLVAYSYAINHLKEGDELLVTIDAHHSNLLPWQMVAEKTKATLIYLDCEKDGSYSKEKVNQAVTEKTKFAALTHVSNVTGRRNPIEELTQKIHRQGGVVLVDAAQSVPHLAVDVQKIDVDFLVFSGHKMLGPMGIGVLYGKKNLLEEMPPFLTGGEMIESVTRDFAVYAQLPHKFEAGTVNAGGAVGLAAAIHYWKEIGLEEIQKKEQYLIRMMMEGMKEINGVTILGSVSPEEHCGIVSFVIKDVHPHDIAAILDADGIAVRAGHHCAQPLLNHLNVSSTARASLAFYNTEEDIERFIKSLATMRRRMGYGE